MLRKVITRATVRRGHEIKARRNSIPFGVLAKPRTALTAAPPIEPLASFIIGGTMELRPSRVFIPGDLMWAPAPMVPARLPTVSEFRRPFPKTRWIM